MAPTARVDRRSCGSSGRCIEAAPEAFGWDEDDVAEELPGVTSVAVERLLEIARHCPTQAITVWSDDGEEIDG